MSESQKNEPFETPEGWDEIIPNTQAHVASMEATPEDPEVWLGAGMHHLMLCTRGRRSGAVRKAALPYWKDSDGHHIVVGSFRGAQKHPAWFLNLRDRKANPEVDIRVHGGAFTAVPEILEGAEYDAIWNALTEDRPFYRDYQALTDRQIPLVRLREKRADQS